MGWNDRYSLAKIIGCVVVEAVHNHGQVQILFGDGKILEINAVEDNLNGNLHVDIMEPSTPTDLSVDKSEPLIIDEHQFDIDGEMKRAVAEALWLIPQNKTHKDD